MKIFALALLSIGLLFSSCNREQNQLETIIEDVLPGEWNILSYELNGAHNLNDYGLPSDTVLYDLGTMTFPMFNIDTLTLNGSGNGVGIDCFISAFNFTEHFRMERLFTSDDGRIWSYFRTSGNGLFAEVNELTNLIEHTHLFWQNFFMEIENKRLITFTSTHDGMVIITLQRKE